MRILPLLLAAFLVVPIMAKAEEGAALAAPVVGIALSNTAPVREMPLRAAIFVQNNAGEVMDGQVSMFRDLLTARLTDKGFAIMDGHDVADRFKETQAESDPVVAVLRAV